MHGNGKLSPETQAIVDQLPSPEEVLSVGPAFRNGRSVLPFPATFPQPTPTSQLQKRDDATRWLVRGFLARGGATLLASLWKAGKSTLISHLLKLFGEGGCFCGLDVQP